MGIEDFMRSFTPGRFQTKSLFKLAQLNAIVACKCQCPLAALFVSSPYRVLHTDEAMRIFEVNPERLHPTKVRGFYGIRKSEACPDVKHAVWEQVAPKIDFPWKFSKSGALSPENYDATDAFLVASYVRDTTPSAEARKAMIIERERV